MRKFTFIAIFFFSLQGYCQDYRSNQWLEGVFREADNYLSQLDKIESKSTKGPYVVRNNNRAFNFHWDKQKNDFGLAQFMGIRYRITAILALVDAPQFSPMEFERVKKEMVAADNLQRVALMVLRKTGWGKSQRKQFRKIVAQFRKLQRKLEEVVGFYRGELPENVISLIDNDSSIFFALEEFSTKVNSLKGATSRIINKYGSNYRYWRDYHTPEMVDLDLTAKELAKLVTPLQDEWEWMVEYEENDKLDPNYLTPWFDAIENYFKNFLDAMNAGENQDKFDDKYRRMVFSALIGFRELEESMLLHIRNLTRVENLEGISGMTKKEITFNNANSVCATVSSPGEIILRRAFLTDGSPEDDFGVVTSGMIRALEALKGADTSLDYRHAEVITRIDEANIIQGTSYYPWSFNIGKDPKDRNPQFKVIDENYIKYSTYRNEYSVFRVKALTHWGETKKRELALLRMKMKESYLRLGTCADFVNWAYLHNITSNWNFIPIVKQAVQMVYLPEGIQTPDDLADSYMTNKICEVNKSELVYPHHKLVKPWANRLKFNRNSNNSKISEHAKRVTALLTKQGVLDDRGQPLVDVVSFKVQSLEDSGYDLSVLD